MPLTTTCIACGMSIYYDRPTAQEWDGCPICSRHLCADCAEIDEAQPESSLSLCCRLRERDAKSRHIHINYLEDTPQNRLIEIESDFAAITCHPEDVVMAIDDLIEQTNPAHERAPWFPSGDAAQHDEHCLTYRRWLDALPRRSICAWCGKPLTDGPDDQPVSHDVCPTCEIAVENGEVEWY